MSTHSSSTGPTGEAGQHPEDSDVPAGTTHSGSGFRKTLFVCLTLTISSAISLAVAEGIARAIYSPIEVVQVVTRDSYDEPDVTAEGSPYELGDDMQLPFVYRIGASDGDHSTNGLGMRDLDRYEKRKPAGSTRILVVGDSVAAGQNVSLDYTLAKLLELELNHPDLNLLDSLDLGARPDRENDMDLPPVQVLVSEQLGGDIAEQLIPPRSPVPIEVLNGATSGYDIQHVRRWVETRGVELSPDYIVYVYCLNDRTVGNVELRRLTFKDGRPVMMLFQANYPYVLDIGEERNAWLLEHSRLWALLQRALASTARKMNRPGLIHQAFIGDQTSEESLERMKRTCDSNDIELSVVIVPYLDQFAPYARKAEHEWIRSRCEALGIHALDLLPRFSTYGEEELQSIGEGGHRDIIHPSALGYQVAAREVLNWLKQLFPSLGRPLQGPR